MNKKTVIISILILSLFLLTGCANSKKSNCGCGNDLNKKHSRY